MIVTTIYVGIQWYVDHATTTVTCPNCGNPKLDVVVASTCIVDCPKCKETIDVRFVPVGLGE